MSSKVLCEEFEECIDWCLKENPIASYDECLISCVTGLDEEDWA